MIMKKEEYVELIKLSKAYLDTETDLTSTDRVTAALLVTDILLAAHREDWPFRSHVFPTALRMLALMIDEMNRIQSSGPKSQS